MTKRAGRQPSKRVYVSFNDDQYNFLQGAAENARLNLPDTVRMCVAWTSQSTGLLLDRIKSDRNFAEALAILSAVKRVGRHPKDSDGPSS